MRWPKYQSAFEVDTMFRQLPWMATALPVTVSGFSRYKTEVADLPPSEAEKVDSVARTVVEGFIPGRYETVGILLVGHADQDLTQGPAFERRMSMERAERVRVSLRAAMLRHATLWRRQKQADGIPIRIDGAGATQRVFRSPRDEAERAANRRVVIHLADALPGYWSFTTLGRPSHPYALAMTVGTRAGPIRGPIPFHIDPNVFDFAPAPGTVNWQATSCVLIRFTYGSPFMRPMAFDVGVIVGAPLTLRDGKKLSVHEAQFDSALAAEVAATTIIGMLDTGTIGPSEIQPRFVGFMGGNLMTSGFGYRVNGCRPTIPKK